MRRPDAQWFISNFSMSLLPMFHYIGKSVDYVVLVIKSAALSAIMVAVALVLARGISGITDASITRNPRTPRT